MTNKKQSIINILIAFVLTICAMFTSIGIYHAFIYKPEVRIVEKKVEVEKREYCPDVTACTPCEEGPPKEKCEFKSFAYEAIKDEKNIYGDYELRKGDIYYFNIPGYDYNWDRFCTDEQDCFGYKMILRKDLFKPIN